MILRLAPLAAALLVSVLPACAQDSQALSPKPFASEPLAQFKEPWAMTFLPDGRLLVTEKAGKLKLHDLASKQSVDVEGVPDVAYGGQGGLGDVVLHPGFAQNGWVYLSYAATDADGLRGATVARARLMLTDDGKASLADTKVIWRQVPFKSGRGHYGHRLAFAPDGHLFISSGERQEFTPAQDMQQNLGKILRVKDDGTLPADNPFAAEGGVAAEVWTLGHRNPLGIAFDAQGRLWEHEMGPKGGDEFNLIQRGRNYGYVTVSDGDHYDGKDIPDHATRPEFEAPHITWTPVVSPAGLIAYSGSRFADWKGRMLMGGLSGQALLVIDVAGEKARVAARYDMGQRIREVEQGPDGSVYLLEDGKNRGGGRLLKLTPTP